MKLYSLALLLATVAVAQTPKPATVTNGQSTQLCSTTPGEHCDPVSSGTLTSSNPFPTTQTPAPKQAPQIISGQSNLAIICTKNGQTNCVDVMCSGRNFVKGCPNYTDVHGCGAAYLWDAEKNTCSITIRFETPKLERVYCSHSKPHTIPQKVTCWYKPNVPPSAKEGK